MIDDKPAFHLFLCRRLWNSYETSQELLDNSPLIVHQLQLGGMHLITDQEERVSAARLCLHAGKLVLRASSFRTAASYFESGIELLGGRLWSDCYSLALPLYTHAAEVEYAIGNPQASKELVDQILANATCMQDKIQAYSTRIYSLGSMHRLQDAIDVSLGVLEELHEPLPRNGGLMHVVGEFVRTSMMLQGMTNDKILDLELMDNWEKSAAMSILNVVFIYFFISKPLLAPLLAMRMVQITLRHGLSAMSGFGFTSYGLILCSLGKIDEGCRFADLGIELNQLIGGQAWAARVLLMSHLFSYPSKYPVRLSIDPLLSSFRYGMTTGDTEFAMYGAQFSCHCAMYSSQPLGRVFRDMKVYRETFVAYKQHLVLAYHEVLMQLVANLLGEESRNPSILDGEFINFEKTLRFAKAEGHQSLQYELYGLNLVAAFLYQDWERCRLMSKGLRKLDEKVVMVMAVRLGTFVDAMANLSRAERCKGFRQRQKLLNRARWTLMRFQRQAVVSPENCLKNAVILEAEFDVVNGKLDSGLRKYQRAMELAEKEGALMEQSIAAERAAMALRKRGRDKEAQPFIESALSSYTKWGAKIKANEMNTLLGTVQDKTSTATGTETATSIQANPCYVDSTVKQRF
eukprot:Sro798_g204000.2  (631) ;mRNA; r:16609-18501